MRQNGQIKSSSGGYLPATNSSSSSSSSSSGSSSSEFKEKIDWIEIAIDRVERAISRLDLKASSVYKKWSDRNSALAQGVGAIREEIQLQEQAYNRYMQEANSVGLSSEWVEKIQNGTIDISTITDEKLKEKIDEYQQWYDKAIESLDAAEQAREDLSSKYAERFENIQTEYEGVISVMEHEKNMLEEYISQAEAKGRLVSTEYYDSLIAYEENAQQKLIAQKNAMIAQLNENVASGAIEKNSEEWVKEVEAINEVTLAIEESNTAILEYQQTIRELEWEKFDSLQEDIKRITEETEFFVELLSNKKLYDDNGQLTDEGKATVGMHGINYNTYMHQADMYAEAMEKVKAAWDADPANQDLKERYYEMLELHRENISLAQKEIEAYKDIVSEGIKLELDALKEVIDARKEALKNEKDLYSYQKKIEESTKNISTLRKQLAAYDSDTSEESKARIQKIKLDLEDAEQKLEESEYDKYISDQEELLDDLYSEYEELLNERLDNIDLLLSEMISATNANAETIKNTLIENASSVGSSISDTMGSIFNTGNKNNITEVVTAYSSNFNTTMTGIKSAIDSIKAYTDSLQKKVDNEAKANSSTASASNASNPQTTNNTPAKTQPSTSGNGEVNVGDKVTFVGGSYYLDSYGTAPLGSKYHGKQLYITNINKKGSHPYHVSTGSKLGSGDLGWLKLNQISGYATGKKDLTDNEVAWTQENGREFIIRPSDGAVLTPLAKGDSVLNAVASGNLWNMANSPADFIRENLGLGDINASVGSGCATSVTQNFEQIVFSMPNVKNYDEFISKMQKDNKFERLINAMTVDQIAGKSRLAKNKAIR